MRINNHVRAEIFDAYNGECQYCGKHADIPHVDHIVPSSKGGADELENLILSCERCNMKKSGNSLTPLGVELAKSIAIRRAPKIRAKLKKYERETPAQKAAKLERKRKENKEAEASRLWLEEKRTKDINNFIALINKLRHVPEVFALHGEYDEQEVALLGLDDRDNMPSFVVVHRSSEFEGCYGWGSYSATYANGTKKCLSLSVDLGFPFWLSRRWTEKGTDRTAIEQIGADTIDAFHAWEAERIGRATITNSIAP